MGEAPVVLLAVEHMRDGPLELGVVPLVVHAQLRVGVAGPCARLGLAVTL